MSTGSTEDDSAQGVPTKTIKIGQFTAAAVVADEDVALYGIEHPDERTATCWIESEEGKPFGVKWTSNQSLDTTGLVRVDGMTCAAMKTTTSPGRAVPNPWTTIDFCDTPHARKKLVFSKIETTDDDAYSSQSIPEDFGLIKLSIWRTEVVATTRHNTSSEKHMLEKVHERSKKAMVHQARLGENLTQPKEWTKVKYIELLATFHFKYRPRDHLLAHGIISSTKKRKATAEDVIDLTIDDDEATEAGGSDRDERIRALEAQIQVLKQKGKKPQHKRVKKEVKAEILEIL